MTRRNEHFVDRLLRRLEERAVHINLLQSTLHDDNNAVGLLDAQAENIRVLLDEVRRVSAERDRLSKQLEAFGSSCTPTIEELTEMLAYGQEKLRKVAAERDELLRQLDCYQAKAAE